MAERWWPAFWANRRSSTVRDQRRASVSDPRPVAQSRHQADPHAPRTGDRLRRRRLRAHLGRSGSMHGDGGMRADQRGHRTVRRRTDQQRRRLHLGPASQHRGSSRLVPGGLRLRSRRQLLQVHQARDRLVHDSVRPALRLPRGDLAAAGRLRCSRFRRTSSITTKKTGSARARAKVYDLDQLRSPADPRSIERDSRCWCRRAAADRMRRRSVLVAGGAERCASSSS